MRGVITVELKGLRFVARHGVYDEEALLGNEFEVDLLMDYKAPDKTITSLGETVNYVAAYTIVQEEMQEPQQLLETCAMKIGTRLHHQFPQIQKLVITIRKLAPPITNFVGSVGVTYTKVFA